MKKEELYETILKALKNQNSDEKNLVMIALYI